VRRPRFGDPLPETMVGHAGAITFGGPMSANDTTDFIRREIDWLAVPLREKKPFLGICLGAQMLAHHLGSRVYRHPDGHAEVGYYPIRPTDIGRMVCDPWPEQVYQWHREGFDLPLGAELLAEGDSFPVQAFRYDGAAFALQFHPDVTHAMMCRWTTRGHERMLLPNAKPRVAHFADRGLRSRREGLARGVPQPLAGEAGGAQAAGLDGVIRRIVFGSTKLGGQLRPRAGGGAEGGRTPDLLIANEALSQLSCGPAKNATVLRVAAGAGHLLKTPFNVSLLAAQL